VTFKNKKNVRHQEPCLIPFWGRGTDYFNFAVSMVGLRIISRPIFSRKVPFANGAPNLNFDIPVLIDLSKKNKIPVCG